MRLLRAIVAVIVATALIDPVRGDQSIGGTIKKIFSTPTPTPARKKKKATSKKESPSPSPRETSEDAEATPRPSARAHSKKSSASSSNSEKASSPSADQTPKSRKKKTKSSPEPTETPSSTPAETPTTVETPAAESENSPAPSASPPRRKNGAPNATLTPDAIKGFEDNPPRVRKLLESALGLTARDLDYTYGSADPANGGMDCSGFVYYVLKQNGVAEVPRDSSQQYVWLRRAGRFEPVASQKEDSFELENLKPGDLLFWTGTYSIERDPPITHSMIYLGREKKTGARVMVGSSDGRIYQGQSRYGVSVFDFKVERRANGESGKLRPTFIGYAHIPGLRDGS